MTMINRIYLLWVLIFILTSCASKPVAERKVSETIPSEFFSSVYDTLDPMEIPITLTPDSWSDLYHKHVDKYGLKIGEMTIDHPFAKLIDHKNYKGIIFVSTDETGSPVLLTFDKNGNQIDGLMLLGDWGGNDPSIGTSEITTINKDLTIHLIDSTSTWDVTPDDERIDSTEQLTVTDELYKISDDGKIIKIR